MSTSSSRQTDGFTVIELVITIAVIGILATLIIIRTGDAQKRAKATDMITALRTTEGAMLNWHVKEGWATWQTENQLGFPNAAHSDPIENPKRTYFFDGSSSVPQTAELNQFLKPAELPAASLGTLRYDNDNDANTDPCTDVDSGVNLQITNGKELFAYLDQAIDNSDGQCGKIAQCNGAFSCVVYRIGLSSNDFPAN